MIFNDDVGKNNVENINTNCKLFFSFFFYKKKIFNSRRMLEEKNPKIGIPYFIFPRQDENDYAKMHFFSNQKNSTIRPFRGQIKFKKKRIT